MSMSDPFLPEPPEAAADHAAQQEIDDVEDDVQPDVDEGGSDSPEEIAAAEHAAEPDLFRTPHAGDRLSTEQLEADLE
jgi:hypothetical protein